MKSISSLLCAIYFYFQFNYVLVHGALATVVESGDEECFSFRAPANVESSIRSVLPLLLLCL